MVFLYSIIMGIVQGLTEFLPVSSSGHLAIFKILFGLDLNTGILFEVMLHVGTLGAIIVAFWPDVKQLALEAVAIVWDVIDNGKRFVENRRTGASRSYTRIIHNNYRKFVMLILVSTIPTGIIGYEARNLVEMAGKTLIFPGIGLLVTGILLLVVDYVSTGEKIPREVTYANAMWVGICQGLAAFPGISRSGITICGCLLSGMNKKFAVKYSFIMSIPAIVGAMLLELGELGGSSMTPAIGFSYLAGAIVAGVVGYFAIRFMLVLVRKKKLRYFAYYCFAVGVVAIVVNFAI